MEGERKEGSKGGREGGREERPVRVGINTIQYKCWSPNNQMFTFTVAIWVLLWVDK